MAGIIGQADFLREAFYVAIIKQAGKAASVMTLAAPVIASSLLLGGCMSSPTYGTDKTANEQLLTDVSSLVSIAPKRKPAIDYKPRPDLVRPGAGEDLTNLPPPQDSIETAGNPDWPESPEQRRARLRQQISDKETQMADGSPRAAETGLKPEYDSPIIADEDMAEGANSYTKQKAGSQRASESGIRPEAERVSQREEVRKRLAESRQGSATTRKFLSEPPLEYRQAAATAPQDDIGEDEYKKERAAKKAARKKGASRWGEWLPW